MKKKKAKKTVKIRNDSSKSKDSARLNSAKNFPKVFTNLSYYYPQEDPNKSDSKPSFIRIFFISLILLIFFSSSIIIFFRDKDRHNIIFNEAKKNIVEKLKKQGPSTEIYKTLAELYKDLNQDLYYLYLKEAFNLIKNDEFYKHRDLIKNLIEVSYQKNEKIQNILNYLVILYKTTKPTNPEYFEILSSIIEIYNSFGNFDLSTKILINLEEIYKQNLQLKYLIANQYYIESNYKLAKEKIDYIIQTKKQKKQPFNINDVILYYNIYSKIYNLDDFYRELVSLSLSLNYQEMSTFLLFLLDKPEINFENYKRIISRIYLYRPDAMDIVDSSPYINLELGRRFWERSEKILAELYFSKALNVKDEQMKKLVQEYIYQIKSKSKVDDQNQQNTTTKEKNLIDSKKILESIK